MQEKEASPTKVSPVDETTTRLLVERLGVGGGGSDVSVTSSLVGAGGLLEGLGSLHIRFLSLVVAVPA